MHTEIQKQLFKQSKENLILIANSKGLENVDRLSKLKLVDLLTPLFLPNSVKSRLDSGLHVEQLKHLVNNKLLNLVETIENFYTMNVQQDEANVLIEQLSTILAKCFDQSEKLVKNKIEYYQNYKAPIVDWLQESPQQSDFVTPPEQQGRSDFVTPPEQQGQTDQDIFSSPMQMHPLQEYEESVADYPEYYQSPYQQPAIFEDYYQEEQCQTDSDCQKLEKAGIIKHSKGKKGKCLKDPTSGQNKCCY